MEFLLILIYTLFLLALSRGGTSGWEKQRLK